MYDEKSLNKFEEQAFKELGKIAEKELTPQSLANAKELLCTLKYIPEVKAMHENESMMESGGMHPYRPERFYDIRSYDNGYNSYDYGMSERQSRNPMTGRYMSGNSGMMSGTPNGYSANMSGTGIQPDVTAMMQQLMNRMDQLEKK